MRARGQDQGLLQRGPGQAGQDGPHGGGSPCPWAPPSPASPAPAPQIAKAKTRAWLSDFISQLQVQIEAFEVEIETARGKGKRGGDIDTMREYEEHITRHNMHIANMEKVRAASLIPASPCPYPGRAMRVCALDLARAGQRRGGPRDGGRAQG